MTASIVYVLALLYRVITHADPYVSLLYVCGVTADLMLLIDDQYMGVAVGDPVFNLGSVISHHLKLPVQPLAMPKTDIEESQTRRRLQVGKRRQLHHSLENTVHATHMHALWKTCTGT